MKCTTFQWGVDNMFREKLKFICSFTLPSINQDRKLNPDQSYLAWLLMISWKTPGSVEVHGSSMSGV